MWLPKVMRIVICMGFPLVLHSCSQVFRCLSPQSIQSSSTAGINKPSSNPVAAPDESEEKLALFESKLPASGDVQSASLAEVARLYFVVGTLGKREESERYFERGRFYAEILCRREPLGVAGQYWLAMNLAGLASVGGAGRALRLLPDIVEKLEIAAVIDGSYDQGGPHRVLGRIYCEAPCWPLSEGNMEESLQHLIIAVTVAPENITNHLYLAQTLLKLGRFEEADRELEEALKATSHSLSLRSHEEDRQEAIRLLKEQSTDDKNP